MRDRVVARVVGEALVRHAPHERMATELRREWTDALIGLDEQDQIGRSGIIRYRVCAEAIDLGALLHLV
jgi:hypothetical protein